MTYFGNIGLFSWMAQILPYHLAIHNDWKVHHFRTDMADHSWMRQEEERFLENLGSVFNATQQDAPARNGQSNRSRLRWHRLRN